MKKLKLTAIYLLLLYLCVGFTACSDGEGEPSNAEYSNHELVGYWKVDGTNKKSLRFYADGTGLENEEERDHRPIQFTWKANNEKKMLFLVKQGSSTQTFYYEFVDDILVIYKSDFSLYDSYSKQAKFTGKTTGSAGNNITYKIDLNSGILTLNGSGDMYDFKDGRQCPWENSGIKKVIIDKGITSLGQSAFSSFYSIIDIELPEGITVIKKWSLSDVNFGVMKIPNSVKRIEEQAFQNDMYDYNYFFNTTLNQVWFDCDNSKLEVVEENALVPMDGNNVVLPNSLKTLGSYAILAHDLEYVHLGSNITYIDSSAFYTDERNWGELYIDCVTPPSISSFGIISLSKYHSNEYGFGYWFYSTKIDDNWRLYVPKESGYDYVYADGWKNFDEIYWQ